MNIGLIHKKDRPFLIKYSNRECPHLTIETNLSCNIKCRSCYNINNEYIKPLDLICKEIETGMQKRRLQTITLIGGEPTLHPDLVSIVAYIHQKGLYCQMLTNGVVFLEDEKDILLEAVIKAGLDKILLHVDEGQHMIHSNPEEVISALFQKFEQKRIFYSLSSTIFPDTQKLIPGKIKRYAHYRYFDGILGLLVRNCEETIKPTFDEADAAQMEAEYEGITEQLGIKPVLYFPTTLDDAKASWLFYFFFINAATGALFSRSRLFIRLFFASYKLIFRQIPFALNFKGPVFYVVFILSSVIEWMINPLRFPAWIGLIKNSRFFSTLRIHTLVLQNPPQYDQEMKQFGFCYHCPDATIRNGKLTPLCLADMINPLPGSDRKEIPEEVRRTVYEHLGEPV